MILGIPVYDGVDVLDVTGPFELLNWAGFDVRIVSPDEFEQWLDDAR